MIRLSDQLGFDILLPNPPVRIVSLVPSITELLFELGLSEKIVGRTRYCISPESEVQDTDVIGGTKNPDIRKIKELEPDLIIANKEENRKSDIDKLKGFATVLMTDVSDLNEAIEMISVIGRATGKEKKANDLVNSIKEEFSEIRPLKNPKTVYFIWNKPLMVAGGDTFINDMLRRAGLANVFEDRQRYPKVSVEEIAEKSPDLVLLSSEPFPYSDKHVKEYKSMFPNAKVLLTDGSIFSWYGSRMCNAPSYFDQLHKAISAD